MNKRQRNKKDIKRLGIPNVCFSLTDVDDKREKKHQKQRVERGFDDSETWGLDSTIAHFIVPRMKRFMEVSDDFILKSDERVMKEKAILCAFELHLKNDFDDLTEEEFEERKQGLLYFAELFHKLWW